MKIKLIFCLTLLFSAYLTASEPKQIIMATTTSTENSGLLNYLLPLFKKKHNIEVKVIPTGTGKAIKLAEQGDVDLIMAHAPSKEKQFVANGFGVNRQSLMYNHFFIVGPKNDPADIKDLNAVTQAFLNIAKTQSIFISRGDHSGTHFKELNIWQQSKQTPKGTWYKEVGQGMGKTLQVASELGGYTLVDQGTWLKLKDKLQLNLLYAGDAMTFNPYSIILVNPKKYPDINYHDAKIFADWITSPQTKAIINHYQVSGQQLFFTKKL